MQLDEFDYNLPAELIAQAPLKEREGGRMLVLDRKSGTWTHRMFADLPELLSAGDLLMMNNSKVFPSRLFGKKTSGGSVECFLLKALSENQYECLLKSSKKKDNIEFVLDGGLKARVVGRGGGDGSFVIEFDLATLGESALGKSANVFESVLEYAQKFGHIPLPPYIEREDNAEDRDRYQTVYAERVGSVAAPTAGLHFNQEMFKSLSARGIQKAEVTLHVGLGTFLPIRAEKIEDHKMHTEYYSVSESAAQAVQKQKASGGRCVAVGTTTIRTLESAALSGTLASQSKISAGQNKTNLFIYPGFEFRVVDALLTNFHQPKSSLLVMLSALADRDLIMAAYQDAIKRRYRFFSYGDCMLVL